MCRLEYAQSRYLYCHRVGGAVAVGDRAKDRFASRSSPADVPPRDLPAQMKSREETLAMSFDAYRQAHTSIDDFSPSRHTRRLLLTGRSATQHFAVVEWMHFRFLPDVRQQKGGERRRREKRGNKSRSTTTASRVPNRQQDSSGEKNEPCRPSGRRAYTNTNNGDGHNNNKWRAAQEMIIRPENCHASSTNNTVSSLPRAFYDRISILIQLFRTCSIGFLSLSFLNYYFARLFCVCGFFMAQNCTFFCVWGGRGGLRDDRPSVSARLLRPYFS